MQMASGGEMYEIITGLIGEIFMKNGLINQLIPFKCHRENIFYIVTNRTSSTRFL